MGASVSVPFARALTHTNRSVLHQKCLRESSRTCRAGEGKELGFNLISTVVYFTHSADP